MKDLNIWDKHRDLRKSLQKSENIYRLDMVNYDFTPIEIIEYFYESCRNKIKYTKENKKKYYKSDVIDLKKLKKKCEEYLNPKSLGVNFSKIYTEEKNANIAISKNVDFGEIVYKTIIQDINNKIKSIERGKNRIDKKINETKIYYINEIKDILKNEKIKDYSKTAETIIDNSI